MTRRLRRVILPGAITSVVALLLIRATMAAGVEPLTLFPQWHHPWNFYLPWLASLPVVGALGAWLSGQLGGSTRDQVSVAVSPPTGLFALMLLLLIPELLFDAPRHGILHTLCGVAYYVACWIITPAVLLIAGVGGLLALTTPRSFARTCESSSSAV